MVEQDFYDLLGVPRGADDAAIKSAYRRMAKECHPDRHNGCSEQAERFKAINEAYDVLKDPQKRAAYDRFGKAAFQNGGGGDPFGEAGFNGFSDIFSTIFGEFMDPRARQNAARGADLRYDLEMTLEEAFTGIEKTVTIEANARCTACDGRGCNGLDRCATACNTENGSPRRSPPASESITTPDTRPLRGPAAVLTIRPQRSGPTAAVRSNGTRTTPACSDRTSRTLGRP